MLRDAARVQPSTIRILISLLVVLGASGSVALLDAAEGALAENRVVSVPLGVGLTVVCAVAASRGLCDAVAQWCTSAGIPFEVTTVDIYFAAAGTAGFWLLAKEFADMGAALPAVLSVSAIAVWCAVVDQATMRIPTSAAYTAATLALFLTVVAGFFESDVPAILRAVEGGFAMALMYLLIAWATGGGLGLGDVRLSLSLGMVLGYQGWPSVGAGLIWPVIVLFPVTVGTIIHRRITGSTSASREIAAGPGLVAGCALALALNG